jgi:hypothetical protein
MSRNRQMPSLLAITLLVLSAFACQTVTKAFSSGQSSPPSVSNIGDVTLSLGWLITPDELNSISSDIGIVQWKTVQDSPGQNRICRTFQGASWSETPNEGLNCILKVTKGSSFADVIDSMFKDGKLMAGAQPVKSTLKLDGEFAVYAGDYPNGHGVFDLIWMKNNLVFWSSVTLGTPAGDTPLTTYTSNSKIIDTFLANVVTKNLEKSK